MAENENPDIAVVLAKLEQEDVAAAEDAGAALEWIAGDQGQAFITQQRIQNFCWYELPVKWFIDLEGKLRVAEALARALDLLQLPRYAAVCRSQTTHEILTAYEISTAQGKNAFRRTAAVSGITPPDLPEFQWGAAMGMEEASAWSSTAEFLEVAVASGDLVPGRRGWKTRQQELTRAHLNSPQPELLGQTLAQVILSERAETWVNLRRSETRHRIVAAIANRLLHPAELPAEAAADPLPTLRWLLDQLDGGVVLTQTGNLSQKFVQQNADRFGWDFSVRRGTRTTCSTCTSCATPSRPPPLRYPGRGAANAVYKRYTRGTSGVHGRSTVAAKHAAAADELGARCQPLVCVGGQPSAAGWRLLGLLAVGGASSVTTATSTGVASGSPTRGVTG